MLTVFMRADVMDQMSWTVPDRPSTAALGDTVLSPNAAKVRRYTAEPETKAKAGDEPRP
jgi:hypothetical protein